MFDNLDERYRWCIYCEADCWVEPENQNHNKHCPVNTGLWPTTEQDYDMEMCCVMCGYDFKVGDHSMLVDCETGQVTKRSATAAVICIGCAVAITILGVKYE